MGGGGVFKGCQHCIEVGWWENVCCSVLHCFGRGWLGSGVSHYPEMFESGVLNET